MEKKNETLGVSFTLPEKLTVREQLKIQSRMALMFDIDDYYLVNFNAIRHILSDWQCELLPDPGELQVNEETDPKITRIIIWTCNEVQSYLNELGNVPKN